MLGNSGGPVSAEAYAVVVEDEALPFRSGSVLSLLCRQVAGYLLNP